MAVSLAAAVLFSTGTVNGKAAEGGVRRMINVVYDDSGSMVANGTMRWSQAKYAMEVFCALMGREDIMNIYPMSIPGEKGLTVNGNNGGRVRSVHNMNGRYVNTPFTTVTKAAEDLMAADGKYEKWLVIITDGEFDDGATPIETVQDAIDSYNNEGIHTIYLAIGDKAKAIKDNPSRGGYAGQAADGVDVLYKVTAMANQIFQHLILPDNHIDVQGDQNTLHIDLPVKNLIVFAQGDNVSIGNITSGGTEIKPNDVQDVKYSDVIPENYPKAVTDTSLKGVVATYESGSTPFQAGDFTLRVSNADTIEYYYTPGVDLNCSLVYKGSPVSGQEKLYAGEYDIRMNFIDPITGNEVNSDLLKVNDYQLILTNNDEEQQIDREQEHVKLKEGDVSLQALAALPGNVNLTSSKNYTVLPEPMDLEISVDGTMPSYRPDQMGENAVPALLRVTDKSGKELTAAQKKATKLEIESSDQVRWEVKYNDGKGKWEARPVFIGNSVAEAPVGETRYKVTASFDLDKQTAHGTSVISMNMDPYEGSLLEVKIGQPDPPYAIKTLTDANGTEVLIRMIDPVTNEPVEISEELWKSLTLKAEGNGEPRKCLLNNGVSWTIKKTDTPGIASLKPGYYGGQKVLTSDGDIPVTVQAEGSVNEYHYTGSDCRPIYIEPLPKREFIWEIVKFALKIIFILWLIIGYIVKKRFRLHGLNPKCRLGTKESGKRRIKKNFLSVILPYVSERAIVKCKNPGYQCNFPDLKIIATGKRSFRILNRSLDLKHTKINGDIYEDMASLKKRSFAMGSFDIMSIDRQTGKKLGYFTFN